MFTLFWAIANLIRRFNREIDTHIYYGDMWRLGPLSFLRHDTMVGPQYSVWFGRHCWDEPWPFGWRFLRYWLDGLIEHAVPLGRFVWRDRLSAWLNRDNIFYPREFPEIGPDDDVPFLNLDLDLGDPFPQE